MTKFTSKHSVQTLRERASRCFEKVRAGPWGPTPKAAGQELRRDRPPETSPGQRGFRVPADQREPAQDLQERGRCLPILARGSRQYPLSRSMTGRSTISPSNQTGPVALAASSTRRAQEISVSDSTKPRFTASICFGWMQSFPPNPRRRARSTSAASRSGSSSAAVTPSSGGRMPVTREASIGRERA